MQKLAKEINYFKNPMQGVKKISSSHLVLWYGWYVNVRGEMPRSTYLNLPQLKQLSKAFVQINKTSHGVKKKSSLYIYKMQKIQFGLFTVYRNKPLKTSDTIFQKFL